MASKDPDQPNIVFILSDDQAVWALGSYGNPEIQTPNLDRLANTGMQFTNFFCTSPVCSPARATLLTGKIPSQHGVHDWIREGNFGEGAIEYLQGQLAYTEVLADQGYVCGMSGKWHLGDSISPQKGFSHWYVHEKGGGPYYNTPMFRNGELVIESKYITEAITDDALDFISKQLSTENPFYSSIHYTAPHDPWINSHPQAIVDLYDKCEFVSCPQEKLPSGFTATMEVEDKRENLKGYFAAVTAMDQQIGRVMEYLEKEGLRESTLICFLSDNGYNCGHHGFWGKGNGTLPLNMYDTSVKVPCIISQPGRIAENIVSDQLLSGYDFMPTLLQYVGFGNYVPSHLPGRSFAGLLKDSAANNSGHEHIVIYDEYGPVRMIRSKEWKYIHRYPYGPHELYDLMNDPNEKSNLVDDSTYCKILDEMRASLHEWFVIYADTDLDGVKQPVEGAGQQTFAGTRAKGQSAFFKYKG